MTEFLSDLILFSVLIKLINRWNEYKIMVSVEVEIVLKIIIAALLGATLGIEREMSKKPAGLRTYTLVCIGSALFAIISLSFVDAGQRADLSRVAAGVVTGIGFLGAGMIFREKDRIVGLTTAAEVWVLGAIGLAAGLGLYGVAILTTVIVLIILLGGKQFERIVLGKK